MSKPRHNIQGCGSNKFLIASASNDEWLPTAQTKKKTLGRHIIFERTVSLMSWAKKNVALNQKINRQHCFGCWRNRLNLEAEAIVSRSLPLTQPWKHHNNNLCLVEVEEQNTTPKKCKSEIEIQYLICTTDTNISWFRFMPRIIGVMNVDNDRSAVGSN